MYPSIRVCVCTLTEERTLRPVSAKVSSPGIHSSARQPQSDHDTSSPGSPLKGSASAWRTKNRSLDSVEEAKFDGLSLSSTPRSKAGLSDRDEFVGSTAGGGRKGGNVLTLRGKGGAKTSAGDAPGAVVYAEDFESAMSLVPADPQTVSLTVCVQEREIE